MIIPALGDKTDRIALGAQQRAQARVVGGGDAGALGHAEGDEGGLVGAPALEELRIRGIGAGISALDIIHAELIKQRRNRDLVLDGKVDAGRLLPVPKRRVEEIDAFPGHVSISNVQITDRLRVFLPALFGPCRRIYRSPG